jgi:TadE-like protein
MSELSTPKRVRASRGAVLVEFALVALAFYLLVAAIVTFGMLIHTAQVAQDAARLAARELSLTALPAAYTFDQAMASPVVRTGIFSPDALVVDLDNIPGGVSLDTYVASMPDVNRALRPLMIYDEVQTTGGLRRLLRIPGALIVSATAPSGLTVAVPQVVNVSASGHETIRWLPVVEEVRTDPANPATGPFSVTSTAPVQGVVAIRINIPSQSSAMGSFITQTPTYAPNMDHPVLADDAGVTAINAAPGPLAGAPSTTGFGANDGVYGLGHVEALAKQIRPFRRVVTAQAFFRREVFTEQSQP